MNFSHRCLAFALSLRKHRIYKMRNFPIETQNEIRYKLVQAGIKTKFGFDHQLHTVRDYHSFKSRIPLRTYDQFKSYFELIQSGGQNILAKGYPRYWGKTGGTTGQDKFIPIYPSAIRQSKSTFETALIHHLEQNPDVKIIGKKLLFLGSCANLTPHYGTPSGFMSSIMVNEFSPLLKKMILPGDRVNSISSWQDKISAIYEMTKDEDICIVAAMPPWMDAFFKYVNQKSGKKICDLWPNLSLLLHSGVSMNSYREEIRNSLGPKSSHFPIFKNGYGATEGNFALQESPHDEDMLLLTDQVYFEFIPFDEYLTGDSKNIQAARIPLEEVKPGIEYVFVLTTPGGLWGYVIGDTIRFTSTHPYKIQIVGRTAQFLNLAGEKVTIDQVLKGIEVACSLTQSRVNEFTLFPACANNTTGQFVPSHEWFVEFTNPPASYKQFTTLLDHELCKQNTLYRVRRSSSFGSFPLLDEPTLKVLKPGTYQTWQTKLGKQGGHFKIPRISTNEEFRGELLKGVQNESEVFGTIRRGAFSTVAASHDHQNIQSSHWG